jgi:hypothetical protein
MSIYSITVYNDMGHLVMSDFNKTSDDIQKFIYRQAYYDLYEATDNENRGCLFHILKDGKEKESLYEFKDNLILITYNVFEFDPESMIKTNPYPLPSHYKE